jgi:hypothetical protein
MPDILLLLGISDRIFITWHNNLSHVAECFLRTQFVILMPFTVVMCYNNKDESEEMHSKRTKYKPVTGDVVGFEL